MPPCPLRWRRAEALSFRQICCRTILKRLPGDQVSFSTVGPGIIHIGSGYAEYRLNILDAAKYPLPEVPFLEDTIPVSGICSLARQTLFAAAARRPTKYS